MYIQPQLNSKHLQSLGEKPMMTKRYNQCVCINRSALFQIKRAELTGTLTFRNEILDWICKYFLTLSSRSNWSLMSRSPTLMRTSGLGKLPFTWQ